MRRGTALLLLRAFRRVKHGDLADVRFAEVHADAVDQHALADRQGRLHRATGNPVWLDDERLDAERQPERDGDDHDQLDDRADRRFLALLDGLRAGAHAAGSPAATPPSASAASEGVSVAPAGPAASSGAASALRPGIGDSLALADPAPAALACACSSTTPRNGSLAARPFWPPATVSATACSAVMPSASVAPARRGVVEQTRLDDLLGAGVAALAHTGALADTVAQVVELRAPDVAARGELDPLDLRRVQREHALDADPEGLLAHRERLARTVTLALDDDTLEDLHAAASTLDHLEVDLDAVAGREAGDAAQLRALDGCDNAAHDDEREGAPFGETAGAPRGVLGRREVQW